MDEKDLPKQFGHKFGRRTKCTPSLIEKLCQVLRAGNYVKVACEYCGISERVFYKWTKRGEAELERMAEEGLEAPEDSEAIYVHFVQQTTRARRAAEVGAVAHIKKAAKNDWRAAAWFLEHGHRERWGKKRFDVDVKSSDNSMQPVLMLPSDGYEKRLRDKYKDQQEEQ